ncbi:MAG: hypothetical protein LBS18_06395, partial [Clostridiales bacterium]|nr:hypothetical protein [Clostridiales bacterium]
METFTTAILNSIMMGCTYTLVAIGYCLFFGVLDVVVFCCGDIAMFGAFSIVGAYAIMLNAGVFTSMPLLLAVLLLILIAAILCAALGLISYYVSIKPFEKSSTLMPLLSTIALGVVIKEILGLVFRPAVNAIAGADVVVGGRNPQAMPPLIAPTSTTSVRNLIIIAVTVVVLV